MFSMTLDRKLKILCGLRRWGQKDLLEAIGGGVNKSSMSNYFAGATRPDLNTALLMARVLTGRNRDRKRRA